MELAGQPGTPRHLGPRSLQFVLFIAVDAVKAVAVAVDLVVVLPIGTPAVIAVIVPLAVVIVVPVVIITVLVVGIYPITVVLLRVVIGLGLFCEARQDGIDATVPS